ncbi:MAG: right-handed parallel beta-helix repeat-containing protein [Pirellulaceae bacterium]|nr:right-handed parallel beta-helix repeat-containing protein [Pirellulaceae bacterium]
MLSRQVRAARRLALERLESRFALATFYVSNSGSDTAAGGTDSPWATLQKAANTVQAGDTVIVRAGNYVGFDLRRDGTAAARIVFQAEPGAAITQRNALTPDGINLEGADYVTIDGFTINGMPRTGIRSVLNQHVIIRNNQLDFNYRWGILTGFSDDLLIENNIATRSQVEHGIYVSNSGDRPTIRDNVIWGNHANGIHMNGDASLGGDGIISGALVENNVIYNNGVGGGSGINGDGLQNSVIRNNLLYDNHASGISLYRIDGGGGSSGNLVVNNTIVQASNGRWALNIQSSSTGNTVRNNILYNHHSFRGSIDISADSLAGFSSDYNVVMNRFTTNGGSSVQSLAQWQTATGQDVHSLVATPSQLFVNPAGGDYHLSATSLALDVGTSTHAPAFDFEGTARPAGSGIDIGADERGGTAPPPPPPTNQAPTDVLLSNQAVRENSAAGTAVGVLSAVDPDTGNTHTFVLVDGAGGRFRLVGNQLQVNSDTALNYEAATSHTVVVRATDAGGLSVDKSLVVSVQNVNELVSFDVQRGMRQRSYVRYLDLVFESADGLAELVAEGRLALTRYNLSGTSGVAVSLAGKASVSGNKIVVNFGSQGIGGNRNSSTGDGYYGLRLDVDDNGSFETVRNFYRLLGDTNGDRAVTTTDRNNVNANLGRTSTLDADINGDGVVNSTDRNLVNSKIGRKIASSLVLHD